jgi:hypothetical protein
MAFVTLVGKRCSARLVGLVGEVFCVFDPVKGSILVLVMAVPSCLVAPVELVVSFGVVEDPESRHVVGVGEPESKGCSDVFIGVDEMMVEEASPDVPCRITGALLSNLFKLGGRSLEAADSFEWSGE